MIDGRDRTDTTDKNICFIYFLCMDIFYIILLFYFLFFQTSSLNVVMRSQVESNARYKNASDVFGIEHLSVCR